LCSSTPATGACCLLPVLFAPSISGVLTIHHSLPMPLPSLLLLQVVLARQTPCPSKTRTAQVGSSAWGAVVPPGDKGHVGANEGAWEAAAGVADTDRSVRRAKQPHQSSLHSLVCGASAAVAAFHVGWCALIELQRPLLYKRCWASHATRCGCSSTWHVSHNS
jgi:hypothetical protein